MQPRIYTYKITFEEVPYYYYGSKKEKKFNEEYWGSPVVNKWCWEFYTPRKQILELFDFTDEGYKECLKVEGRLIKPVLNNPLCLNESCGGNYSLETRRKSSKKGVQRLKELGTGIYSLSSEELSENGKKGGARATELGVGIHGRTKEQMSETGKKAGKIGGKIGGKISGKVTYELGIGVHAQTTEQLRELGRKSGKLTYELGIGVHAQTTEQRTENGKKGGAISGNQKWKCLETGIIANAGNLAKYQKARGIDTSQRIRLEC
jgi:general stress protein YciG